MQFLLGIRGNGETDDDTAKESGFLLFEKGVPFADCRPPSTPVQRLRGPLPLPEHRGGTGDFESEFEGAQRSETFSEAQNGQEGKNGVSMPQLIRTGGRQSIREDGKLAQVYSD